MARIILTNRPSMWHATDIIIDGQKAGDIKETIVEGRFIEFDLPSKARWAAEAHRIFKLTGSLYVVLYESYNARARPHIKRTEGCEVIFEYGDEHGMRWGALLKVTAPTWLIDYDIPGHHGHYWRPKRLVGDANGFRDATVERLQEEAEEV
jgi:hypothetical protein